VEKTQAISKALGHLNWKCIAIDEFTKGNQTQEKTFSQQEENYRQR
jgi:hypothetical protein